MHGQTMPQKIPLPTVEHIYNANVAWKWVASFEST